MLQRALLGSDCVSPGLSQSGVSEKNAKWIRSVNTCLEFVHDGPSTDLGVIMTVVVGIVWFRWIRYRWCVSILQVTLYAQRYSATRPGERAVESGEPVECFEKKRRKRMF